MTITKLLPRHADVAARLHMAGQPGTFLTDLGPDVLTALYRALPVSSVGFGYAAVSEPREPLAEQASQSAIRNPQSAILGFVSATTSTARLFAEVGTRHFSLLLPPLIRRFWQRPRLIGASLQTLFYPLLLQRQDQHPEQQRSAPCAELLSIMVEPTRRGQGIGAQLMEALLVECVVRQVPWLEVTVDATNAGAQRFYVHHGFQPVHHFKLFGRAMYSYMRKIEL